MDTTNATSDATYRTNAQIGESRRDRAGAAEIVLMILSVAGFVRGLGELALSGTCGVEATVALLVAIFATREILTLRHERTS